MNEVDISIVLPIYNVDKYLSACLDSIIEQQVENVEVIAINDCSSDESLTILRQYAEKYTFIRVINNPQNCGLAFTRNLGIEEASGKYVYFMDADDVLKKNALNNMLHFAELNKCEIVICNADRINEEGKIIESNVVGENNIDHSIVSGKKLFSLFQVTNCRFYMSWLGLVNREFLNKNNIRYINYILHEDMYFAFAVLMNAQSSAFLNITVYSWRKRELSITAKREGIDNFKGYLKTYIEIFKFYTNNNDNVDLETRKSIEKYLDEIKRRVIYVYKRIDNIYSYGWNDYERMMISLLFVESNYKENAWKERIERLEIPNKIYLYGAGVIATDILKNWDTKQSEIMGIIVSDRKDNPSYLFGRKVLEITEVDDPSIPILLCLSKKNESEVVEMLKSKGFSNIYFL